MTSNKFFFGEVGAFLKLDFNKLSVTATVTVTDSQLRHHSRLPLAMIGASCVYVFFLQEIEPKTLYKARQWLNTYSL